MSDTQLRWGIIGPGSIANNFAAGLAVAPKARLVAASGRNQGRLEKFADTHGVDGKHRHVGHQSLLDDQQVDAVYISTSNVSHAQIAIDALRSGKHVLCEKPAGLNSAEVKAMVDVASDCDRFFAEGFMYLFHPQIKRLVEVVSSGVIGEVESIDSTLCFEASYDPKSRLFDPDVAGGAIMDVGCYPVSFSRLIAGISLGSRFADPLQIRGMARKAPSGVDSHSFALLKFDNGIIAECNCSVAREMQSSATVHGRIGTVYLDNPWTPGRDAGPADTRIVIHVDHKETIEEFKYPEILFSLEAEQVSEAILAGAREAPAPAMGWQDSVGNATVMERWRDEVGYGLAQEKAEGGTRLSKVVASPRKQMPMVTIPGLQRSLSSLVMGCDNQIRTSDANMIWDAWLEAGGNAFDTAWSYGMGAIESNLGAWIDARGVRDEVVVIVKGAHTPHCDPHNLRLQLEQSLERLRAERADIYIMHRDNLDIPVGEFMDQINELIGMGMIGVSGASNWTLGRFKTANAWADDNGRAPFSIMNNNLSLAVMEKEVWPGCTTSNNAETLSYLRETNTAHLSWSSQARGYFLPEGTLVNLPDGTRPEQCFESEANAKRRGRARELAKKKGVSAMNIAAAWVLGQSFPSIALVGPRRPAEIATSLPALDLELTEDEISWLNLETD